MSAFSATSSDGKSVSIEPGDDGSVVVKDETRATLATVWKDGYVTGNAAEALKRIVSGFTGAPAK